MVYTHRIMMFCLIKFSFLFQLETAFPFVSFFTFKVKKFQAFNDWRLERQNHLAEKYRAWELLRSRGWYTQGKLGAEVRVPPHLVLKDNVRSLLSGGVSRTPALAVSCWTS